MRLLVDSGCVGNVIGFESLEESNVLGMRKAPNMVAAGGGRKRGWDRYQAQCDILRDHHLQTWAAFTIGHEHDTWESIRETHHFAMANKFCFAAYNILMPYPGTPLYDRMTREGRHLWGGQWWLHPEYRFNHAAFVPKNLTPEELTEVCLQNRTEWNSASSIFRRAWDFKTHMHSLTRLGVYLTYNPLYARETLKKHGMSFGLFRATADPGRTATTAGPEVAHRSVTGVRPPVSSGGVT
jgi:hypothetical protein